MTYDRIAALALSALLFTCASAVAAPPDGVPPEENAKPRIREARTNALTGDLSIFGEGFTPDGSAELRVVLGGPEGTGDAPGEITELCIPMQPASNLIECDVSLLVLSPGDYLLTVETGPGQSDEFSVAFGEVGPRGAKGAKGDKGATGDKGARGDKGATGDKGAKGDPGPRGPNGVFDTSSIRPLRRTGFTDKVFCEDPSDIVIGGGGVCLADSRRAVIDRPIFNPPGWEYNCSEAGLPDNAQQVWVTCAAP